MIRDANAGMTNKETTEMKNAQKSYQGHEIQIRTRMEMARHDGFDIIPGQPSMEDIDLKSMTMYLGVAIASRFDGGGLSGEEYYGALCGFEGWGVGNCIVGMFTIGEKLRRDALAKD